MKGLEWKVALVILGLAVSGALAADLVALWTGFGYADADPFTALWPSGSFGVPQQGASYDGDRLESFSWLDRDSDGVLRAVESPQGVRFPELEEARRSLLVLQSEFTLRSGGRHGDCAPLERWDPLVFRIAAVDSGQLDRNGDGLICADEFMWTCAPLWFSSTDFQVQDFDRDGQLTRGEFLGPPRLARHWLGTDVLGRDLLVRWLYAIRVSLLVVLVAAGVATVLGSLSGLFFGFLGGRMDRLYLSSLEVLQAVPFFIVVLLLSVVVRRALSGSAGNLWTAVLLFAGLGAVQWFSMGRFARGLARDLRNSPFITVLVDMGWPLRLIVTRHLLPNAWVPLLSFATLLVPTLVLEEAFLSFLGFGVQAPHPSVGVLLNEGIRVWNVSSLLWLVPASTLALLTWSLTALGDRFGRGTA